MNRALKTLAAAFSANLERHPVCGACGKEFTCGASLKGCWCSEVKLNDAAREQLRSRYNDCLCPICLERAANSALDPDINQP